MLSATSPTLIVLLCFGFVTADVNVLFRKTEKYNENAQLFALNIYNSLLIIVKCEKDFGSTRKCNVSQTALNSIGNEVSCEFVLDEYLHDVTGHPWTANRAVLFSPSKKEDKEQYVKYTILNFSDCKTAEAKIEFESHHDAYENLQQNKHAIWMNEDGTFDVVYNDPKQPSKKNYRLRLDAQGNRVSQPIPFSVQPNSFKYAKKGPTSESFIVTQAYWGEDFKCSLIKPDGEQVVLKKYTGAKSFDPDDVSTSHGSIRFCAGRKLGFNGGGKEIDCELFDASGTLMSNISMNLPQEFGTATVENLANGDFLLLIEGSYYIGSDADTVMKVKSDGSIVGVVSLSRFRETHYRQDIIDVDVDDNKYCVSRGGSDGRSQLSVVRECFGDSDFH